MKLNILSLIICSVVTISNTLGQIFTDIHAPLNHIVDSEFIIGDIDNDGDLDILTYPIWNYTNTPAKVFENKDGTYQVIHEWPGIISKKMNWAETNNDNFLDLIFHNELYINSNGSAFVSTGIPISSNSFWADFDNDGDLDFIETGETKLYRNDGYNNFAEMLIDFPESRWASWCDSDNDSDFDLLICDFNSSILFINNGDHTFSETSNDLIGIRNQHNSPPQSSAEFGDYNNDSLQDLLIAGAETKLYRNVGNNQFSEIVIEELASLIDGYYSDWGDFDNDGDLDFVISALDSDWSTSPKILENQGDNNFHNINADLIGIRYGNVKWADYDNDNDLDLIQGHESRIVIYQSNGVNQINTPPEIPTNLASTVTQNSVILSWNPSADTQTPSQGLTYNLRVGSSPDASDIVMSLTATSTNRRLIPTFGNVLHNTSWKLNNLENGTYYWSVQAEDNSYMLSPFAEEQSFIINHMIPPLVESVSPVPNTNNIAPIPEIEIKFNQDLNLDSLNTKTFIIRNSQMGNITPNNISYNQADQSYLVSFNDAFFPGTKINFTITDQIINMNNPLIPYPFSWEGIIQTGWAFPAFHVIRSYIMDKVPLLSIPGDFDNDGDVDLVITHDEYPASFSVHRNEGNYNFNNYHTYGIAQRASLGMTGDFNNDGNLDVILGIPGREYLSILLNNGQGYFNEAPLIYISHITDIAVADINMDGNLDIFVLRRSDKNEFLHYLNDGSANFQLNAKTGTQNDPFQIVCADWNNDGLLDMAVTHTNGRVNIYKNKGDGTFNVYSQLSINGGESPIITCSDIDNDYYQDIILKNENGEIHLFENDGEGYFTNNNILESFRINPSYAKLDIVDIDGDGLLDIVDQSLYHNVVIFKNKGFFHFDEICSLSSGYISFADFDNDSDIDLVGLKHTYGDPQYHFFINEPFSKIRLNYNVISFGNTILGTVKDKYINVYNDGIGDSLNIAEISSTDIFNVTDIPGSVATGDSAELTISFSPSFDQYFRDSIFISSDDPDNPQTKIILSGRGTSFSNIKPGQNSVANNTNDAIEIIFLYDMDSTTFTDQNINVFSTMQGKLNSDSIQYIEDLRKLIFIPERNFFNGEKIEVNITQGISTQTGDSLKAPFYWSFDTKSEESSGGFQEITSINTDVSPVSITSNDFNKDGLIDLAIVNSGSHNISIFENTGSAVFELKENVITLDQPNNLMPVDTDNDGDLDLIVSYNVGNSLSIFINDGFAHFTEGNSINFSSNDLIFGTGDFTGDGLYDITVISENAGTLNILENLSENKFQLVRSQYLLPSITNIKTFDFDNDGFLDIVASTNNSLITCQNIGSLVFKPFQTIKTDRVILDYDMADLTGDQYLDLVLTTTAHYYQDWGSVIIYHNMNNGSLVRKSKLPNSSVYYPLKILIKDINGDSHKDLAVLNGKEAQVVRFFCNDGSGDFTIHSVTGTINDPIGISSGDYNNNGSIDFSVLSKDQNVVSILLNDNIVNLKTEKIQIPYFKLHQNYPNPFNPITIVSFDVAKASHVLLKIYDINGREVTTLKDEAMQAGSYKVEFNAHGLSSGVYFYRIDIDSFHETKKMILLR